MSIQTHDFSGDFSSPTIAMMQRTKELTATQRLVILLYLELGGQGRRAMVEKTAKELAAYVGLTPTMFSRVRQQLIDGEWLEQLGHRAQVKFYGLTPKARGENRVLRLASRG